MKRCPPSHCSMHLNLAFAVANSCSILLGLIRDIMRHLCLTGISGPKETRSDFWQHEWGFIVVNMFDNKTQATVCFVCLKI